MLCLMCLQWGLQFKFYWDFQLCFIPMLQLLCHKIIKRGVPPCPEKKQVSDTVNPYKPGVLFMGHLGKQNSPGCDVAK